MTAFTSNLWREVDGLFARVLAHPFLRGLTDGTLSRERFLFYVVQDALYLREFARALSLAAARAPREDWTLTLNQHAAGTVEVERALHEGFFRDLGLSTQRVRASATAPTNLAYTSYLMAVAQAGPFAETVAAVLPCYWIYWEVGRALLAKGSPDALYRRWIATYGAEDFGALVQAVRVMADEEATRASEDTRQAMRRHFLTTSRYEWMFWDMAWRMEEWPV